MARRIAFFILPIVARAVERWPVDGEVLVEQIERIISVWRALAE